MDEKIEVTNEATTNTEAKEKPVQAEPMKKTWKEKLKKPAIVAGSLAALLVAFNKGKTAGYNKRCAEEADEKIDEEYDEPDEEEE